MKPGQIRQLYLEPRLHKQSVKQEINVTLCKKEKKKIHVLNCINYYILPKRIRKSTNILQSFADNQNIV
jgi:hypothetical protein